MSAACGAGSEWYFKGRIPESISKNIAHGLRVNGLASRGEIHDRVEHALRRAALWEEVNGILNESAYALSGGQQQRLCIARAGRRSGNPLA